MKTIFKSTLLLAAAGLSLLTTSCKDDNESNPTLTQPTEFVLNQPAINGNIDLARSAVMTLTWSQPTPYNNFNAPVVPTYWIEVSTTGSFTKIFDADAEDNTGADYFALDETYGSGKNVEVNTETLNRALVQFCAWEESAVPDLQKLYIRVKSAIRDARRGRVELTARCVGAAPMKHAGTARKVPVGLFPPPLSGAAPQRPPRLKGGGQRAPRKTDSGLR